MKTLYDKLVRGDLLSRANQERVLRSYCYRWTVENLERAKSWLRSPDRYPTMTPVTDRQWLRDHAWAVNPDGSLDQRQRHALPGSMAACQPGEEATR